MVKPGNAGGAEGPEHVFRHLEILLPDDDRALIESAVQLHLTPLYGRPSSPTELSSSRTPPPSPWSEPNSSWSERKLIRLPLHTVPPLSRRCLAMSAPVTFRKSRKS